MMDLNSGPGLHQPASCSEVFNKIVRECKVNTRLHIGNYKPLPQSSLPVFDEVLCASAKLESDLVSFTAVFGTFLDTVQRLRDNAVNTQSNGEETSTN